MQSVCVMMSTYNGERYLEEQVLSILNQKGIETYLIIRDDGSTDNTCRILDKLCLLNTDRIKVYKGKNIGYNKSFLKLLGYAEGYDYYAYADQDDYWLPDKCLRAINILSNKNACLYVSALSITNQEYELLYNKEFRKKYNTMEGVFAGYRYPGCTMVFTNQVREQAKSFLDFNCPAKWFPTHDFITTVSGFISGKVVLDNQSKILHRRFENSVSAGGNGVLKRIKTEWNIIVNRINQRSIVAKWLLSSEALNTYKYREFLQNIVDAKHGFKAKIKLILNPKFRSGSILCNIETFIKILINNY